MATLTNPFSDLEAPLLLEEAREEARSDTSHVPSVSGPSSSVSTAAPDTGEDGPEYADTQPEEDLPGLETGQFRAWQPRRQRLTKKQVLWNAMIHMQSPVHVDKPLTDIIDFEDHFCTWPPRFTQRTPKSVRILAYIVQISAAANFIVWISCGLAVFVLWRSEKAWTEAANNIAVWLASWEWILLVRAIARKATTDLWKPLASVGMFFDIAIWNPWLQLMFAMRVFFMDKDLQALQREEQLGYIGFQFVVWVVAVAAWVVAVDAILRFIWPFVTICLKGEAARNVAVRVIRKLPVCKEVQECTICIERGRGLCTLPCEHHFHISCLEDWVNERPKGASCPVCRRALI